MYSFCFILTQTLKNHQKVYLVDSNRTWAVYKFIKSDKLYQHFLVLLVFPKRCGRPVLFLPRKCLYSTSSKRNKNIIINTFCVYLGKCGCAVAWQFSNFKNLCGPNGTLGGNFSTYTRTVVYRLYLIGL